MVVSEGEPASEEQQRRVLANISDITLVAEVSGTILQELISTASCAFGAYELLTMVLSQIPTLKTQTLVMAKCL